MTLILVKNIAPITNGDNTINEEAQEKILSATLLLEDSAVTSVIEAIGSKVAKIRLPDDGILLLVSSKTLSTLEEHTSFAQTIVMGEKSNLADENSCKAM
eukprot:1925975-Ditylum_brightwellii.AAC.1